MYTYNAKLDRVVDGDTVDLNIDLGFDIWVKKRVRLHHVDTPEKRTRDLLEKHFGNLASEFVVDTLANAGKITVSTTLDGNLDKYGRVLGVLWADNALVSINDQLIDNRLAVEYNGQNKSDVEEEHINNRNYLIENGLTTLSSDNQKLYEESK